MSVQRAFERAGVPAATAKREAPLAESAMRSARITTQSRAAMFLAQVLHESGGLRWFEEIADGSAYEGRCRDLGNCHPGDGRRFKGRGPIQLTGRANYRRAGAELGLPLEQHPEIASGHAIGWRIAGWFWEDKGLKALADRGDFRGITVRINGRATEGEPSHFARRRQILATVKREDCRPRPAGPAAWLTKNELRLVREYDTLKRAGRQDTRRARALVQEMTLQRKRIWHAAQGHGGWGHACRRERYRSLHSRTV